MIKFDVLNRWTGEVQFTAEIECPEGEATSVKLGLAVRWAVKNKTNLADANLARANLARANLAGANLARAYFADANLADANLARANLAGAHLARANLADANLAGAYLARAYLADANLARANLARANLADAKGLPRLVQGPTRSDGYAFIMIERDGAWRIIAGCRDFDMGRARKHWGADYRDAALGAETQMILDQMEALRDLRWPAETKAEAAA